MEHFNGIPSKGVKEKNMYILHLDTPRIIILCSVILGVVVISFLLGMNLFKSSEKPEDLLARRDKLTDFPLPGAGLDNKGIPGEDALLPPLDDAGKNALLPGDDKLAVPGSKEHSIASMEKNPGHGDILTSDNIKEIIPPVDETKKVAAVEEPVKKSAKIKKKSRSKKKQRVVEVSSREKNEGEKRVSRNGFAVQVASYDSRSKAMSEIDRLKKMNYDAYVDKTEVKGKHYYRVRIGPVATKAKAVELLNEVQGNDRYSESYLVKE